MSRRLSKLVADRTKRLARARAVLLAEAQGKPIPPFCRHWITDVSRHVDIKLIPLHWDDNNPAHREYIRKLCTEGWDRQMLDTTPQTNQTKHSD